MRAVGAASAAIPATAGLLVSVFVSHVARRHINGAVSNSDAGDVASDAALTMSTLFEKFASWTVHLSEGQRELLFAGSAEKFYRI